MRCLHLDHLSHSQIQGFTRCPRQWTYDKVDGALRERLPAPLAFGIAVHDTLAAVNEAQLLGEAVSVQEVFQARWQAAISSDIPIAYGTESAAQLASTGAALVTAYQPPPGIIGVEQPFTLELDTALPPVTGRIDLVRRDDQGNLILADLKTASSRVLADTEAVAAQLGLYDLAYPATRHEVIVLGKLKKPTITTQAITPWSAPRLRQHYREIYSAMQAGIRYAIRGWACGGCPFRDRCVSEG